MGKHSLVKWSWTARSARAEVGKTDAERWHFEYLQCISEKDVYYSFPVEGGHRFVQILEHVSASKKFVHTKAQSKKAYVHRVLLQPLEVSGEPTAEQVDVYALEDASIKEMAALAPWPILRHDLRRWQARVSDTFGCVELHSACPATPTMPLTDRQCPELLCLEELRRLGWNKGKRHGASHIPEQDPVGLKFEYAAGSSHKFYLQCLLSLAELAGRGLTALHVGQLQSYYLSVLAAPDVSVVLPGRPRKEYLQFLESVEAGEPCFPTVGDAAGDVPLPAPAVEAVAPAPLPQALALDGRADGAGSDAEDDIVADDANAPAVLLQQQPDGPAIPNDAGSSSSSSSSSSTASSQGSESSSSDIVADVAAESEFPTVVEGCPLLIDEYAPQHGSAYRRLYLVCNKHERCKKYRNAGPRQTAELGPYEPVAFLACWYRAGHAGQTAKEHINTVPSKPAMRQWLSDNLAHLRGDVR